MLCPHCYQKALPFSKYVFLNPFKYFECGCCGATLKTALFIQVLCILSLCVALGSFVYSFPIMYDVIHSQSNSVVQFLLGLVFPYVVIPLQVIAMFVPVALYTWIWGKLKVIALPPGGRDILAT